MERWYVIGVPNLDINGRMPAEQTPGLDCPCRVCDAILFDAWERMTNGGLHVDTSGTAGRIMYAAGPAPTTGSDLQRLVLDGHAAQDRIGGRALEAVHGIVNKANLVNMPVHDMNRRSVILNRPGWQ